MATNVLVSTYVNRYAPIKMIKFTFRFTVSVFCCVYFVFTTLWELGFFFFFFFFY